MSEVTDPNILKQLESGPREVTDPALLAQLEGSSKLKDARKFVSDYYDYLHQPTEKPTGVGDFIKRVVPESISKTAVGLAEFPYQMGKGIGDIIQKRAIEGQPAINSDTGKPSTGGRVVDTLAGIGEKGAETVLGMSKFMGEPIGAYGLGAAKERWSTDPAGSLFAVAPILHAGIQRLVQSKKPITIETPLKEATAPPPAPPEAPTPTEAPPTPTLAPEATVAPKTAPGTPEFYKAEADRLGVEFKGITKTGLPSRPEMVMFQDGNNKTGAGSFTLNPGESVEQALTRARARYETPKPTAESGPAPAQEPAPSEKRAEERPVRSGYPEDQVPDLPTVESDMAAVKRSLGQMEKDYAIKREKDPSSMDTLALADRIKTHQKSMYQLETRKIELQKQEKLSTGIPQAKPAEGELFPGQKKEFRLSSTEAPEAIKPFAPTPAEQPLLTGTEKAYKDVGMVEKVADPITEQVDSLRSILPDFELGKKIWSQDPTKPEVLHGTSSTYPPWFKDVFRNDSAKQVMDAIDKWKKGGDSVLGKKESRIMASVKDLAKDSEDRGVDIGQEHWRDMLSERGSSPEIARAAQQIKEFFVPLSTIPQGKAYLTLRYKDLLGGLTRVDRIVGQLSDRFKGISITDKADVFNAIRGEIPMDTLPTELQTIAKQTRADLDRTGQMLVKRGLLKKETFEANKDTYIHYLYLRHILPDGESIPVGRSGRLDLSYLKARKDLPESVRKELGLIEDVSVAAPVGMGKALGDVVKADFFKKVAANPEWVWQPSKEIAKLTSELKNYKQIVERGENVGPEVIAKYKQLESDLAAKSAAAGKAPADFVQLPDTPSYGEMKGAFVRKEIANDIVPIYSANLGDLEGLAKVWSHVGKGFDAGMTVFKVSKVALNPPTAIRNVFSNFIQINMSGIPIYRVPDTVIGGVKSMIAKDKLFRTLERNGGFKTNFSVAELGEVLKTFEDAKRGSVSKFFSAVGSMAKYYGKIDDIAKMSLFKDAVTRQGMSVPDAVQYAQKWGMDYSLASRSVKHGRRYALPFLSYQYKIAPLVAETLVNRPWVLAKYIAIPYLMAKYAASKYDWTDKDLDKAQQMMKERTQGQGAYMILPVKDNKGNIEIVNMEYFLPWGNWLEAARDLRGGNFIDTAKQFGGVLGPYGNVISMLNTKRQGEPPKDPFTGQAVYSKLDSPQDKYLKQTEWWWKLFGPSSFSSSGALGYTAKAIAGGKDKWGVEATGAKALGRWMGVNIGSLDPTSVMATRKFKIRELDAEIHKIYRDPKYSKEDRKNALRQLQIERKKILSPE